MFPKNEVFNYLTVIGSAWIPNGKGRLRGWVCRCVCGEEGTYPPSKIRRGLIKSCGCKSGALISASRRGVQSYTKHLQCFTPTYNSWAGMKARCSYKKHVSYKNYGGRGIKVCPRWQDFRCFLEDMGQRPEGMSLDRIDPNGDYTPTNCRWATAKQQRENQR